MSPRIPTRPPTEPCMWRKLLARAHPDTGGEHELFIWTQAVRAAVCGKAGEGYEKPHNTRRGYEGPRPSEDQAARVPFDEAYDLVDSFEDLTARALGVAGKAEEPYARVLHALADCYEASEYDRVLFRQQHQGATYKSLAAIAYKAGMSRPQRIRWYRIAESIPLSQRHAGYILSRLQDEEAA